MQDRCGWHRAQLRRVEVGDRPSALGTQVTLPGRGLAPPHVLWPPPYLNEVLPFHFGKVHYSPTLPPNPRTVLHALETICLPKRLC